MELRDKAISRRQLFKTMVGAGLAVGGIALLDAGCGTAQAPAPTAKPEVSTKPDVNAAKKEGVVSLYTSLDTAIVDTIIKPFKDQYGIDVKYYRAGATDVATKVLNEWDAKQYLCDVLDVSDIPTVNMMKTRGMLAKYNPASLDAYPANMRDKDGFWTADRLTQIILGYNTKSISGDMVPKSWADLADPKYSGKMVMQEPNTFTLRIYAVVTNLKDGWNWLAKVGKNKPGYVQTVQVMEQMNETGEIPIAIFQNDNIVSRAHAGGKPVNMVYPKEGVVTEPGAIALMNKTSHPNAGKLFIDWWLGDQGQKANVAGFKYSPRPDMAPPEGCPPLKDLTLWEEDNNYLQAHMNEVADKITKALGG